MTIAFLKYKRGFTTQDFYNLLSHGTNCQTEELINYPELIKQQLRRLGIEQVFLTFLELNHEELTRLSTDCLMDMPIRLTNKIKTGFSEEMISWLKHNSSFFEQEIINLRLKNKLSYSDLELLIFDDINSKELGRTSLEHTDKRMVMIEVSIDDMNPEFYSYIMEGLFALGVNDVYINQVLMKKNRPGQVLHVLCQEEIREEVIANLFRETTTLGLRYIPYIVQRLEREFLTVDSELGQLDVKVGKYSGEVVQIAPEYDQCAKIARESNIPIKVVYDQAKQLGYDKVNKK